MKYSATDSPSRYEEMIGRGMISPFGLFTRPRMPAMLRTCSQLPRAPDVTMRLMVLSVGKFSRIATATSSVAFVQIWMSSWRRSRSVVRPFSNCAVTFAACFSYFATISPLFGGVRMSESATVTPERVAQRKPASLIRSRVAATSVLG